jgi:DNA invertase Pin-like site-specific DNA recombinase
VTETALKRRRAVYTRKSTDEGLDMAFNSLDAQREACEAYGASQRGEGWMLVADHYDDGGFSGGTLERPALRRLLADIQAGKVDCVVVYKIDRLTRALMDFSKLVDLFEKHSVTFVSVTQSFNTTTSMGRLTLNMLLSFAQFERELGSERVRDKIAASKRRGLWTGGVVPLGYKVENKQLIVEPAEAALVRRIFQRYVTLRSITKVLRELDADGVHQRSGRSFDKIVLHKILKNRTYR